MKQDPALPLAGPFSWKDDFKDKTLSPAWIMLRTPKETWWKLDPTAGQILLTPSSESLSGTANPSYFGRRVQHPRFTASTTLEIPKNSGISAGIPLFLNEKHHYFFGVRQAATGPEIFLESAKGGAPELVETAPLGNTAKINLRVIVNDGKCSFEYAGESGSWKPLVSDADATIVTSAVGGGFVGATVGMHAQVEE